MWPFAAAIVMAVMAIAVLPRWRYMRRADLGYGPTVAMVLLLVVVLITWARGLF